MYRITFIDDTTFDGGTINNSKWNEMPPKQIKRLDYFLFDKKIIFENYEAYNHIVEYSYIINIKQNIISKIILMAKKDNQIVAVLFDTLHKCVQIKNYEFGREYLGRSTTGWKQGIPHQNPIFKVI